MGMTDRRGQQARQGLDGNRREGRSLAQVSRYNICVSIQNQCELGIEPVFWKDESERDDAPSAIIRFPG